jgi:hypothetical protein
MKMVGLLRGGARDGDHIEVEHDAEVIRVPVAIPLERLGDDVDPAVIERRALLYRRSGRLVSEFSDVTVGACFDFAGYER